MSHRQCHHVPLKHAEGSGGGRRLHGALLHRYNGEGGQRHFFYSQWHRGIGLLAFAALYRTAAGGVGEGWVGGTAALAAAIDLALLLLEGVAKGK